MSFKVFLKFTKGCLKGCSISYDKKQHVSIGRSGGCVLTLPEDYHDVSNRHCILDVDPPFVRVMDTDSLNGTLLNNQLIGRGDLPKSKNDSQWYPMKSGDILQLTTNCEIELKVEFPTSCTERSCAFLLQPKSVQDSDLPRCFECKAKNINRCKCIAGYSYLHRIDEGEGSMGEVWKIQNEKTGETRVIKYMLPDAPSDEKRKEWFQREINIGKQIKNPYVVQQFQSGKIKDNYYILMEYCRGGNLKDFMNRDDLKIEYKKKDGGVGYEQIFSGRSEEAINKRIEIATHIIYQVLDGLDFIHHLQVKTTLPDGKRKSAGLVHRDIKPQNILLSDTSVYPTVKLGDFGLAKAFQLAGLTTNTYSGAIAGNANFIPREQIENYRYAKPDVDIWAAAAVYYYMLTGGIPPKNLKSKNIEYNAALQENAIPVREQEPLIPAALAAVIDKALKEKPLEREKTTKEQNENREKQQVYGFEKASVFKNKIEQAINEASV